MNRFSEIIKSKIMLKKRCERKDILFWSFIFAVLQLILLYSGGIIFGFVSAYSNYAVQAIGSFAVLIGLLFAKEFLRAFLLFVSEKVRLNKYVSYFAVTVLMSATDFIFAKQIYCNGSDKSYIVMTVVTAVLNSALFTLMCKRGAALPSIVFSVLVYCIPCLVPFKPNISLKMQMFICLAMSLIFIIVLDCAFTEDKPPKKISFLAGKIRCVAATFGVIAVAVCIMFFCGMLTVSPVAVATGSMEPQIAVGDVVIVSKSDKDIDVGDVIQFKRDGKTVIHRIISKNEVNGNMRYTTKGDANNAPDVGYVTETDIIGKVTGTVPKIGNLTLWLHSN